MDQRDLDVVTLSEQLKSLYGDDVYNVALQRALAMATRNTIAPARGGNEADTVGNDSKRACLTTEAVLAAVHTEFLRLVRPH